MDAEPVDPRVRCGLVYWIACTVCGPAGLGFAPTFDSEEELWASLLRTHDRGWVRLDDGRILCDRHRTFITCDTLGHLVTPWHGHPLDDELEWRFCSRCGQQFEQRGIPV